MEKPMLGGCCVCLDERGWAENPLVYCDGQSCTIAVHQACYGIVSVPSGPWFCRKCELNESQQKLTCKLCPHQEGAFKKTDTGDWAHVICALYIPEVQFGNVSTMEPIVLSKVPQERFDKDCYICQEKDSGSKKVGACMGCARSGCKMSFHVTCAQLSGLLCEEAGSSNTTKYCGYCSQHLSKDGANLSQLKDVSRDKSSVQGVMDQSNATTDNSSTNMSQPKESVSHISNTFSEAQFESNVKELKGKKRSSGQKSTDNKKAAKKSKKNTAGTSNKKPAKDANTEEVVIQAGIREDSVNLDEVGYATAPKHSVVTLSSFGEDFMVPSQPSDIGKNHLPPLENMPDTMDGLSAIEQMIAQQKGEILQFFREFGPPNASAILQELQQVREENAKLQDSINKLTRGRDQLLAIKAKLSIPFKNPSHVTGVTSAELLESKPYTN